MTTTLDTTPDILSDVVAFLETLHSPVSAFEAPPEAPSVPADATRPQATRTEQPAGKERPVTIFLAYVSPADDEFRKRIEGDLKTLQLQKWPIICTTHDISKAVELSTDIDKPLDAYELFLFLLSPDFVQLEYSYSPQMENLIKSHKNGVWVSPVLLRECLWEDTPFCRKDDPLPVLPSLLPITGWPDPDKAFKEIANGVKRAVEYLKMHRG